MEIDESVDQTPLGDITNNGSASGDSKSDTKTEGTLSQTLSQKSFKSAASVSAQGDAEDEILEEEKMDTAIEETFEETKQAFLAISKETNPELTNGMTVSSTPEASTSTTATTARVEPVPSGSKFEKLSMTLHRYIYEFLLTTDVIKLGCVSKKMQTCSEDKLMWSRKIKCPFETGREKKMEFIGRRLTKKNFLEGIYHPCLLQGHTDAIHTVDLDPFKETLVSGSKDSSVKFWNIKRKRCATYHGHGADVKKVLLWEGGAVSASIDKTVHVWNPETDEAKILRGHGASVINLSLLESDPTKVLSSSHDHTMRLWDLNEGKLVQKLTDHEGAVRCLENNSSIIASACSGDTKSLCIYDTATCKLLNKTEVVTQVIGGRADAIRGNDIHSLHLTNNNYLFVGETKRVRLWDLRMKIKDNNEALDLLNSNSSIGFKPRNVTIKLDLGRTASRASAIHTMRYQQTRDLLAVGSGGSYGAAIIDVRKRGMHHVFDSHEYPMIAMAAGEDTMEDMVITAGTTRGYQYQLIMNQMSMGKQSQPMVYIPGHKNVITTMKLSNHMIATGAKDGSLRVLNFKRTKKDLKRSSASFSLRNVHKK